jgi:hypothetical protein
LKFMICLEPAKVIINVKHQTSNIKKNKRMKTNRFIEIAVKVVVAALTAFLTAITITSCMGHGPIAF